MTDSVNYRPFIERLPKAMHIRQRMTLEALGISASIVALGIRELRTAALHALSRATADEDSVEFTDDERTRSFIHAWSIVDHLQNVGSLLRAGKDFISMKENSPILAHCKTARKIRNQMDHAPQNIKGNIANAAKSTSLLGAISFVWLREGVDYEDGFLSTGRVVVTVGAGIHRGMHVNAGLSLDSVRRGKLPMLPCDNFVLHAFDLHLDLSEASARLKVFIDELGAELETQSKAHALQTSAETGRPYEEIMEPPYGRTTLVITFNFDNKLPFAPSRSDNGGQQ